MFDLDLGLGDAVKSCSEEAREWWKLRQQRKDEKRFVAILDEMLRNLRQIEELLIALGEEQMRRGLTNVRTASWIGAFKKWRNAGI